MICNAVKSFTMSKRLTQAVMKASILNIMYQRMLLNQADLKTRDIEGTAIMVFKRKHAKDPLLQQYLVWMKGIIDAIDKNYVSNMYLFLMVIKIIIYYSASLLGYSNLFSQSC